MSSLISNDELTNLMQISPTASQMKFIAVVLPLITDFVFEYTNNDFKNTKVYVRNSDISFDATTNKITNGQSNFLTEYFVKDAHYVIEGSLHNDGIVYAVGVSAGEMIITPDDKIVTEDSDETTLIAKIEFPRSLKRTIAKMVKYDLNDISQKGLSSETIGNYSASYSASYPESITKELNQYRRVAW